MNIIVNYPRDKEAIDNLNEKIGEFKATLIIESIKGLNISDKGKRNVVKELLKGMKSGKYNA